MCSCRTHTRCWPYWTNEGDRDAGADVRGDKGVINVKTTARNGKVRSILLVHEDSELMIISHYGKIIRIDTKHIREAGRSTQGVRLLQLEPGDKVAASCVILPEVVEGTLLQ